MMSYSEMVARRDELREKDKAQGLTVQEEVQLDYLEQKLDDVETDIEFSF